MEVKPQYEELMRKFFELSNGIRDMIFIVFPEAKTAGVDDVYSIRKVVTRMQETHSLLELMLTSRKRLRDIPPKF